MIYSRKMQNNPTKKCVVICGPTASGKSGLALKLAARLNSVIISADSMQIYRTLDIGTAKPTPEDRSKVRHELIDICEPDESFSVAKYKKLAYSLIDGANAGGVLPFVVGGTGLYTDSVLFNTEFADIPDSPELRQSLNEEYDRIGGEKLLERLAAIDPEAASKLHPADRKRIVRALEIYGLTGKTLTQHNLASRTSPPDTEFLILVTCFSDRNELYKRINARVDDMLAAGLEKEARGLFEQGRERFPTASQAIGYKEFFAYFRGECTYNDAVELLKQRTRNYAKRQMTWFNKYVGLGAHFIEMSDENAFIKAQEEVKRFAGGRFEKASGAGE